MTSIGHLITSGIFSLDGEDFDVDNNVWIVGDDRECVVLDCAHGATYDVAPQRVGSRTVRDFCDQPLRRGCMTCSTKRGMSSGVAG